VLQSSHIVIKEAIALLESWRGRLVRVEEALARSASEKWEYDRRFCAWSRFALVVQRVAFKERFGKEAERVSMFRLAGE
jgi:hypothetical protein